MASRSYRVIVDGTRYRVSEKQARALEEPRYSFNEAFVDLGSRAQQVMLSLAALGLFKATSKGWARTRVGGRVNKAVAKRRSEGV